ETTRKLRRKLHETIRKVTDDIDRRLQFNTAISAIMELVNDLQNYRDHVPQDQQDIGLWQEVVKNLIRLLAHFAPHLAEELWELSGGEYSVHLQPWPKYEPAALTVEKVTIVVQVDGKLRDRVEVAADADGAQLEQAAL